MFISLFLFFRGLSAYVQSMYIMRLYGLLHFAKVKVEILKVTHHIEDGTVRVRWRVNGLPRHRLVLQLWKQKVMNVANVTPEDTEYVYTFFSSLNVFIDLCYVFKFT